VSAHLDRSPIVMLLGRKDNYTLAPRCVAYVDELRAKGAQISVAVYPNAYHAFDDDIPLRDTTNWTRCAELSRQNRSRCRNLHHAPGRYRAHRQRRPGRGQAVLHSRVNYGDDPERREEASVEVAAVLKATFGL
jgi:dienelactone hydrolase